MGPAGSERGTHVRRGQAMARVGSVARLRAAQLLSLRSVNALQRCFLIKCWDVFFSSREPNTDTRYVAEGLFRGFGVKQARGVLAFADGAFSVSSRSSRAGSATAGAPRSPCLVGSRERRVRLARAGTGTWPASPRGRPVRPSYPQRHTLMGLKSLCEVFLLLFRRCDGA